MSDGDIIKLSIDGQYVILIIVTLTVLDDFEKKLDSVNQQLFRFYNNGQICGSILATLILFEEYYAMFLMGDSRMYQKRGLSFSQLTKDDNGKILIRFLQGFCLKI